MAKPEPETLVIDPTPQKGELKSIGGSQSDDVNLFLINQAINVVRTKGLDADALTKQHVTTVRMMAGIAPTDELEGMLATQLIASHSAAIDSCRRAMIADAFEVRQAHLSAAGKLSRTYATLLEALNRHRGKGQQRVTVEHVHVHDGGQAIVGSVEGGGMRTKLEKQPHALGYAPGQTLRSEGAERQAVPVTGNAKR